MPQEMSFAQALNEARQIIVQQSNRIKTDLEKLKSLQETIAAQTGTIVESDRQFKQKTADLESASEQLKSVTSQLEETRTAKEQGEAVINRQGQTIVGLEKQLAEHAEKVEQITRELDSIRGQVPTQEDADALAALASLLSAKKGTPAPKPQDGAAAA